MSLFDTKFGQRELPIGETGSMIAGLPYLPVADENNYMKAYLYTGETDENYTKGHTYVCKRSAGGYAWEDVSATYRAADVDSLVASMLNAGNYHAVMKAWFAANGAAIQGDLTELVEKWYRITRTGWTGGTTFWNTDQSELSTGTKVGDNAGLVCEPSTNAVAGRDDYAGLPLFAVTDCNWYLDQFGIKHIRAIKGVDSLYAFVDTDPTKPVGVLQMAPWLKVEQGATSYTELITDEEFADGFQPWPSAIDGYNNIHSWVLHAKYGMGDAFSSITGVPIRTWDINYNSQRTQVPAAFENNKYYCGETSSDDAWMKLWVHIKYASLTLDGIMNGCCSYHNSALHPAVAETSVRRVLVTTAQGAGLVVGSTVCLGSTTYGGKSTQCSVVDRARIVSIETVEVEGTNYSAVNLDVEDAFDTTTELFLTTMPWHTGSTDNVLGNDGSPYSNTSSKEPYKLQGIEHSYGYYVAMGDTILRYAEVDGANVLQMCVCRNASKLAGSVTADYVVAAYTVPCPATEGWQYIKRLGFDPALPELWFPKEIGGSSSTYTRDALYIKAVSTGLFEWLALGALSGGLSVAGLSCASASYGLSYATWAIGGRLSANGFRGEYAAQAA